MKSANRLTNIIKNQNYDNYLKIDIIDEVVYFEFYRDIDDMRQMSI